MKEGWFAGYKPLAAADHADRCVAPDSVTMKEGWFAGYKPLVAADHADRCVEEGREEKGLHGATVEISTELAFAGTYIARVNVPEIPAGGASIRIVQHLDQYATAMPSNSPATRLLKIDRSVWRAASVIWLVVSYLVLCELPILSLKSPERVDAYWTIGLVLVISCVYMGIGFCLLLGKDDEVLTLTSRPQAQDNYMDVREWDRIPMGMHMVAGTMALTITLFILLWLVFAQPWL